MATNKKGTENLNLNVKGRPSPSDSKGSGPDEQTIAQLNELKAQIANLKANNQYLNAECFRLVGRYGSMADRYAKFVEAQKAIVCALKRENTQLESELKTASDDKKDLELFKANILAGVPVHLDVEDASSDGMYTVYWDQKTNMLRSIEVVD